jgi:hypothetical protein
VRLNNQEEDADDFDLVSDLDTSDDEVQSLQIAPETPLPSGTMAAEFTEGRLETTVGNPQKELAGTKDAYVSYQITTKVRSPAALLLPCRSATNIQCAVRLPVLPTPRVLSTTPFYRLRLPMETVDERIPTMRDPTTAR